MYYIIEKTCFKMSFEKVLNFTRKVSLKSVLKKSFEKVLNSLRKTLSKICFLIVKKFV